MCKFDYSWYPFDTQSCGQRRTVSYSNVQLRAGGLISYTGKSDIGKYFFRKIQFCDVDKYGRMGLFIDMIFSRPLTGSFMTI